MLTQARSQDFLWGGAFRTWAELDQYNHRLRATDTLLYFINIEW